MFLYVPRTVNGVNDIVHKSGNEYIVGAKFFSVGERGYLFSRCTAIDVTNPAYETDAFINYMEHGEKYAKCASTVINDIDGHYFNTAVFTGSAALREYIAAALSDTLNSKKSGKTPAQALNSAISEAIKKM